MSSAPPPADRWFDLSRYDGVGAVIEEACLRSRSNRFLALTNRGRTTRELTFRQFRAEQLGLAGGLARRGVAPGTRVAILCANGPAWLTGAAAILHLGGVIVPLDPKLEPAEQARLLTHCAAEVLLTDGPTWRRLAKERPASLREVVVSQPIGELGEAACARAVLLEESGETPPLAERQRDDVAAIVYSSGTGGRAKGCLLTHGNYLAQMQALANLYPMQEDDVYLSVLPTNHALDFMCGFLVPLLCGASVVHLETLRPEFVLGALKDQGVTHMSAVPALLTALERRLREKLTGLPPLADAGLRGLRKLNQLLTRRTPNHTVSRALLHPIHEALGGRLRRIFAGGAFVPAETARFLYELGFPVAVGYGLTEACAVVSVNDLAPFRDDTVGPPVPGTELRLHGRDGRGRGEVWIRGPQVFAGYLDDPELTAATLEDGWLKTGDLGEVDATGHLRLVGRIKNMIVTAGGKNVYPEDVEGRFHGVDAEELAVLAAHTVWSSAPGEDEALLLAVRPRGERPDVREQLLARNRRLPAYQRAEGVLWVDDPFPRTTSLKLKRTELARSLRARGRDALERL